MLSAAEKEDTSMSIACEKQCHRFSLAEVKSATNNFNEALVIGKGGFGKVYKGFIHYQGGEGGSIAAIKRFDSRSQQGAPEFWAEIEMLSKLRHCNLVSLIGYCNDDNEMILVYEYIPNGTLADKLHNRVGTPLSWIHRLKICIGAARGLDYLHTGAGIHHGVIHRDVKSSNILLEENWAAKISDFGLSKIGPANLPSTYVNTCVKGTFGYMDPEYFSTGRLTRKSDVYAFGVVLLEVLCGRCAVDKSLDEEQWGLAGWAQDCIKEGKVAQIIDPTLKGQSLPKCLKEFAQIAVLCLHCRPKGRPTMSEVVVSLEVLLSLQEKADDSIQTVGLKTFTGKVQKFFFPLIGAGSDDAKQWRNIETPKDNMLQGNDEDVQNDSLAMKEQEDESLGPLCKIDMSDTICGLVKECRVVQEEIDDKDENEMKVKPPYKRRFLQNIQGQNVQRGSNQKDLMEGTLKSLFLRKQPKQNPWLSKRNNIYLLCSVTGEAIRGWIPSRYDTVRNLNAIRYQICKFGTKFSKTA